MDLISEMINQMYINAQVEKVFFFNFMYISRFFNFRSFKPLFEKSSNLEKLLQKKINVKT